MVISDRHSAKDYSRSYCISALQTWCMRACFVCVSGTAASSAMDQGGLSTGSFQVMLQPNFLLLFDFLCFKQIMAAPKTVWRFPVLFFSFLFFLCLSFFLLFLVVLVSGVSWCVVKTFSRSSTGTGVQGLLAKREFLPCILVSRDGLCLQ